MATRITLCGFCRRLICGPTESGPASEGQETGPSLCSPLLPDNFMVEDTYCGDCERFYHQLITFGRGNQCMTDWTDPPHPVQYLPPSQITTVSPA